LLFYGMLACFTGFFGAIMDSPTGKHLKCCLCFSEKQLHYYAVLLLNKIVTLTKI
jgi:hypothetical protein